MKFKTLFLFLFLSRAVLGQQSIGKSIYFDSDQSELNDFSKQILDFIGDEVKDLRNSEIELIGHTDDRGDLEYNLKLSKRRVDAVQDYFLNLGIDHEKLNINYYGEARPIAPNSTMEARRANRRVEIKINFESVSKVSTVTAVAEPSPELNENKELDFGNPYEVLTDLQSKPQIFCIQNARDTILQGAEGTILFLPKGSFMDRDITCDCIEIQLTEFYDPAQILRNNLNTQSSSRLLETRGAIKLEAYCDNKKLTLKRGKKIDLYFPEVNEEDQFELFTGVESGDQIDWKKNTRKFPSAFFPNGNFSRGGGSSQNYCGYNFFIKRWICNWKASRRSKRNFNSLSAFMQELMDAYPNVSFVDMSQKFRKENLKVFTSNKLGFINCDRFLNYPKRDVTNVYIKGEEEEEMITYIVFKNRQSVMNGRMDTEGKHWFVRIPKKEAVKIVAIKKTETAYALAVRDYEKLDEVIDDLAFNPVSKEELNTSLESIGW